MLTQPLAVNYLRGVAQAQNEGNKSGGIGGVLLQIEIANDDNDPAIAKQIAAEFVKDSEILAVIYAIETAHTEKIAICADSQDEASRSYKEEFTWSVFENGGEVLPTVTVTARKMWGGAGSWRTAMAYDATKAIIAGLQSGLKRSQLQKALSTPGFSFEGATGTIQFLPSGDHNMKGTFRQSDNDQP